jgi:hypothetical protein
MDGDNFAHELAYDEGGNVRIKSTCTQCGESPLVNIRDSSLWNWEENHQCDQPQKPSSVS